MCVWQCAATLRKSFIAGPSHNPYPRAGWYGEPNAIGYAKFFSRSHDAVIRVYDAAGNVIETPLRALIASDLAWQKTD